MRRKARWPRGRSLVLGLVGLTATGVAPTFAQVATPTLTVQPREAATGTQNPAAGEYPMGPDSNVIVSIPPQCVGVRRCPLLVALPGGGQPASVMTSWIHPVADRYGFILMAPNEETTYDASTMDAALKDVLKRFAIDPAKIAISGRCASGATGMRYGIDNLHVFSRIASISGGASTHGLDPQNTTTEFLLDAGYRESAGNFAAVNELRKGGHPVRHTVTLRGHEHQGDDYGFLGRWLSESWAKPATRPGAPAVIDPLPQLTTDAVARLITFWTIFFKEPDSIRTTGRQAYIRDVVAPVGTERPVVPMTDMAALAARYPTVAAALKSAGLTGQEHDAYRTAIITAMVAQSSEDAVGNIDSNSVLAQNIAFLTEHADELETLASAGIDDQRVLRGLGGCCTDPAQVNAIGPLGIWRTP